MPTRDTDVLQRLPSVTDESAWLTKPSASDVGAVVSHVMTLVESDASDEKTSVVSRMLAKREYTRAELLLIAQELPFDPKASHNFGRGFNPADCERIVNEHREMRAWLQVQMDEEQLVKLCTRFPELSPDDFKCSGFNGRNERMYRYVKPTEEN